MLDAGLQWGTGSPRPRGSRRKLLRSVITGGIAVAGGRRAARAQDPSLTALRLSGWAHVEPSTRDAMQRTLDLFDQLYGARVEAVPIPFGSTLGQIRALHEIGNQPDVMQLSGHWSHALGREGLLADLGAAPYSLRAEIPQLFQDPFPGVVEGGVFRGALYAVPFSVAPLGLWYNRKLLEAAEISLDNTRWTIQEFNGVLRQLKAANKDRKDIYPIRIDVSSGEYAVTRFWPWIWSFGGDPMQVDELGKLTYDWTDAGTVEAFTWLQNLISDGLLMPPGLPERQFFADGKIAFLLDGPYMVSQIANFKPEYVAKSSLNEVFGVTMPPVRDPEASPVTVLDLHQLAIARQPRNPLLAQKLVRFLTTNELSIRTFLIPQGGLLPVRRDNIETYATDYEDSIGRAFIYQMAPSMRLPPLSPWYGAAAGKIAVALQDIALKNTSVADRLALLNKELSIALRSAGMV